MKKSNVAGVPTPLNAEIPIVAPVSASSGCVRPTGVQVAPSGEYAAVTFVPSDCMRRKIVSVVRKPLERSTAPWSSGWPPRCRMNSTFRPFGVLM